MVKGLSRSDLDACLKIGCLGICSNSIELNQKSLRLVKGLVTKDSEIAENIDDNNFITILSFLASRNSEVHKNALTIVVCCFTLENNRMI